MRANGKLFWHGLCPWGLDVQCIWCRVVIHPVAFAMDRHLTFRVDMKQLCKYRSCLVYTRLQAPFPGYVGLWLRETTAATGRFKRARGAGAAGQGRRWLAERPQGCWAGWVCVLVEGAPFFGGRF